MDKVLDKNLSAMLSKKLSKKKYCQIEIPFYTKSNIVLKLSVSQPSCDTKE